MILDFTILRPRMDGMGLYGKNILDRLLSRSGDSTLLLARGYDAGAGVEGRVARLLRVRSALLHRFSPGLLLRLTTRELYYSPTQHGPALYGRKVITVHDLLPLLFPGKSRRQHIYYRFWLPVSLRFCRRVITISRVTKRLLIERYGIPEGRITVIHPGTDVETIRPRPVEGVEPGGYFLMVGVNSEYKNYRRVIEALDALGRPDARLVLTSGNPAVIAQCAGRANVQTMEYLGYDQIVWLLKHARALVYPSLLEGFGLPALEAARLGVPIITSRGSPMEEFLGAGNALYVDPMDTEQIRDALGKVLGGEYPSERVARAREATAALTWENTADRVLEVLEEARQSPGR